VLGRAYQDGNGVPQNDALALKWFQKAADQGDATAENSLGNMYRLGEGVEGAKKEAVRWYQRAAKRGNPNAMFNLGASYYSGDGVAFDDVRAYAWFLLAQEAGNPAAGDVLRKVASEHPSAPNEALVRVAEMYEPGGELPENSFEALKWYRKAADVGNAEAAVAVTKHLLAPGRNPNREEYAESRQRCQDAANRSSAPGAYCLALIYRRGVGVTKDPAESTKWLSRAADLGYPRAALELGELYWKGVGVKPDLITAYMWIWLASLSKEPGAERDVKDLRKELPKKSVAEAKQRAIEWGRAHPPVRLRRQVDSTPAK
jgi:TPR repeat protein